jgi:hypothetical protein
MKHLTIRHVSKRLAQALEREKRRRGASLNQTVLDVLGDALGVTSPSGHRTGLARLAGTWTAEEQARFEATVASTEQVDEELWR